MYHPVGLPQDLADRLGVPVAQIIKLDANENPFGAPPGVAEALAAFPAFHRYPDPAARELRAALAAYTGAEASRIVVGNGSDELLDLVCRLFIRPGDRVITCEPTFGMYAVAARLNGATVVDVPRRADFTVDVAGVVQAAAGAKLAVPVHPQQPDRDDTAGGRACAGSLKPAKPAWWSLTKPTPSTPGPVACRSPARIPT